MKKKILGLIGVSALAPLFAFAQQGGIQTIGCSNAGDISYIICRISGFINSIIPILISLGVVYFIWGVISYAIAKEEEAKKEGRARIIYGIIALLVIVSIWGLVAILQNTFGIGSAGSGTTTYVPCIPSPGITCQ